MKGKIKTWHITLMSFMTLFIAVLTSMLSLNATTPTSTDEEESTVDNWELGIVFYDTTIGNGKTPLTEYNWDATNKDEIRDIIIQINYKNDNVVTTYSPGELKIKIPRLQSYNNYFELFEITADYIYATEKNKNWTYYYDGNYIVLYNNQTITEKTNIEGSIQIDFRPSPQQITNNLNQEFIATLETNNLTLTTSNKITFNFTSTERNHTLTKTPSAITAYDGLPDGADKYIWIQWNLSLTSSSGVRSIYIDQASGYIFRSVEDIYKNSFYFLEHIPDNAIAIDKNGNILNNENGTVKINNWNSSLDSQQIYTITTKVLIGYPIEEYSNTQITNTVEAYGIFWDETEEEQLAIYTKEINSADYKFEYTGNSGFGFQKYWSQNMLSASRAAYDYSSLGFFISLKNIYLGEPVDLEVCDDIIMAPNSKNEYVRLQDDEFYFSQIIWRTGLIKNALGGDIGEHDLELWVRYKDETEYILYDTIKTNDYNYTIYYKQYYFNFEETNIVGWKIIIKDLDESIIDSYPYAICAEMKITKKDLPDNGTLYNFAYLKGYDSEGNFLNPAKLENYSSTMTQMDIAAYDIDTYGTYLTRSVGGATIISNKISFWQWLTANNNGKLSNNQIKEKFEGSYAVYSQVDLDYGIANDFDGMICYDLLPIGMEYDGWERNDSLSQHFNANNIKTKSGISVNLDYFYNHVFIEVKENWQNTNRTLVIIKYDFSDDPLDLSDCIFVSFPRMSLKVSVSYDNYFEYGSQYTNIILMDSLDRYNGEFIACEHGTWKVLDEITYNSSYGKIDELDINENGKHEFLLSASATLTIVDLVESHQEVQIQVKSDESNFSLGIVDAPADSIYTYKLKTQTGIASVTNFTIYCNIENASKRPQWKGTFQGIDTTYASKSYTIKVYYSESNSAGSLTTDASWKEYDEATVDKSKVKSLAFRYLNSEGNPAVLPSGAYTYVLIKMKAPIEEHITLAYNRCWTEWNAIDEFNRPVDYITGIKSNIVKVALPSSVKDMWKTIVNIHFNKAITGEEADFENMKLDKSDTFKFQITLTNQETGDIVTGVLDSKNGLTFGLLPVGTYVVTESDDNYFDFIEMVDGNDPEIIIEGITFEKVGNDYILTIIEDVEEDISFQINVTNEIEDKRFYEEKHNKENLFLINKTGIDHNVPEE